MLVVQGLWLRVEVGSIFDRRKTGRFQRHPCVTSSTDALAAVRKECLPEWPIQSTGELGRIGHQGDLVPVPGVDKPAFNGLDSSIHHVARCNAVSTGLCVVDGNLSNSLNGGLGVDCTVLVEDTAMAVVGVFAKTDITCDVEVGEMGDNCLDRLDHRPIDVVCRTSVSVLQVIARFRNREVVGDTVGIHLGTIERNAKQNNAGKTLFD